MLGCDTARFALIVLFSLPCMASTMRLTYVALQDFKPCLPLIAY